MSENENKEETPPVKSENEISDYYEGVRKQEMQDNENGIKKARTALFVVAGLLLISEIISASAAGIELNALAIGIIVVEVGIFIALALWTKTKPYSAIITGLIVFIALWILAIAVTGARAAYSGIIIRIAIIATLVSAMKPAKAWEDAKKNS